MDSNPAAARSLAESELAAATGADDIGRVAACLYVVGAARIHAGEYATGESELRRALDLARSVGDQALIVRILRSLLRCGFLTRNREAALLRGLQALQVAKEIGDRVAEARTHNDVGLVYRDAGDFEGALEHLLAGLRALEQSGSPPFGSLLNNIGNVHLELGDAPRALEFYESALEAYRSGGERRGEAIALGNVARTHARLGQLEDAIRAHEAGLALLSGPDDGAYRAPALARYGATLAAAVRDDEAARAFADAFAIVESSPGREFEDEVLIDAARYHISRGEPGRGIELLKRALAVLPSGEATRHHQDVHELLADAYERVGDAWAALVHYKEFHRIRGAVADSATAIRVHGMLLQFDVEHARQREEIYRLRNVELARANADLRDLQAQLVSKNRELERLSALDPLTGVHNRRYLDARFELEIERARRHRRPLTVAMCDVDHFKSINDEYSHAAGDEVLRRIGSILRSTLRMTDVAVRYGGEEFLLILPDTDLSGARGLADRVRRAVAEHPWSEVAPALTVTISVGAARLMEGGDAETLIAAADERLYAAKHAGRDTVAT